MTDQPIVIPDTAQRQFSSQMIQIAANQTIDKFLVQDKSPIDHVQIPNDYQYNN